MKIYICVYIRGCISRVVGVYKTFGDAYKEIVQLADTYDNCMISTSMLCLS